MSVDRAWEVAAILTVVWALMFAVFFLIEGVVVPLEPLFDGYAGVMATSILKVASSALVVLAWLAFWDQMAIRYYSSKAKRTSVLEK